MSYDYEACKRSFEYLFVLDAFGKFKCLESVRIVRAHVPSSGEETGHQNYLRQMVSPMYAAALKSDISFGGMY
ncbi:hypothetical protein TNCV_2103861 [Trichonephila clavipes]|nr:hypothetical protein TNCV_2103861 [Trichonephila clavipes]